MANFLDEAEDVTEKVGYKVKKSSAAPKAKSKSILDDAEDLGEAPKGSGVDMEPGYFMKALNVLDIPSSLIRTGVEAAVNPERDVLPAMGEQLTRTMQSPTTAAEYAPTGADINKQTFGIQNPMSEAQKSENPVLNAAVNAVSFGAGIATESLMDPLVWFKPSKAVTKPLRQKLESASERQAAKAVSKYASKTDVMKEGVDLEAIGARLVAEDLQGMLKKPTSLYEKLSGKRHIQKTLPDSLSTLTIKRGEREPGEIGRISKDITNTLARVESEHGLQAQVPANIMMAELMKNVRTNLSKTSGETVNLDKVESVLQEALKPFEAMEVPKKIDSNAAMIKAMTGVTPKSMAKEAVASPDVLKVKTKLGLGDLQQLRKNIGKQVADRAFYATADMSVKQETEVLRDLYRSLGDVIQGQLQGKKVMIGSSLVDAGDYYKAQNNRLKQFLDLESMLEYQPIEALRDPDMAAKLASMAIRGTSYGAAGAAASMAGLPLNPMGAAITGGIIGVGQSAAEATKGAMPEYLTSILKTAGKVSTTPYLPEVAGRGAISYMRDGKFVSEPNKGQGMFQNVKPAFPFNSNPQEQIRSLPGRNPNSVVGMTPAEVARTRLPRSTEGLLQNKELVLAKLAVNGVPDEMIATVAQALNDSPEDIGAVASLVATQFPTIFEKSKYQMFDGKLLNPQERAKAADDTSKRDDLNSIQKAKIISELNKTGKWLGE
jgi:hypothetical protein